MRVDITEEQASALKEAASLYPSLAELHRNLVSMITCAEASAAIIEAARDKYATDDVEIDDEPAVSDADRGCWVAAWVWVDSHDADDLDDTDEAA